MREVSLLAGFARRSPREFALSFRRAMSLTLDRAFYDASRVPLLPEGLARRLTEVEVKLPPRGLLVDGTQDFDGLWFLAALSKLLDAHSLFEIGTFTGVTALTLAANLPQLVVHTLDLPVGVATALEIERDDKKYVSSQPRRHAFDGRPEAARIICHEGDSAQFDPLSLGAKFDIVYVDGAHSYQYVNNDTRVAFDLVADDGAIVWDDYQRCWPGVVRYLEERSDLSLYRVPGTRLVLWLSGAAASILGRV